MRWTVVTLSLVLVLVLGLVPEAMAAPVRTAVAGTWAWENTAWESKALPNGDENGFGEVGHGSEIATWTGGFSGTSVDTFKAVFQPNGEGGFGIGTLWVNFDGTVNDVDGKMLLRVTFWAHGDGTMIGHWTIVKGWDGLEGLSGQGTWSIGDAVAADYNGVVLMK